MGIIVEVNKLIKRSRSVCSFFQNLHLIYQVDTPISGVKACLPQSENHQIIFEYSHEEQWGIVLEVRNQHLLKETVILFKKRLNTELFI